MIALEAKSSILQQSSCQLDYSHYLIVAISARPTAQLPSSWLCCRLRQLRQLRRLLQSTEHDRQTAEYSETLCTLSIQAPAQLPSFTPLGAEKSHPSLATYDSWQQGARFGHGELNNPCRRTHRGLCFFCTRAPPPQGADLSLPLQCLFLRMRPSC